MKLNPVVPRSHCPVMCDSQAGSGGWAVSLNWSVSQRTSFSEEFKSIFSKKNNLVISWMSEKQCGLLWLPLTTLITCLLLTSPSKKQREYGWCYPSNDIRWFWGRNRTKDIQLPMFAFYFEAPGKVIQRKMATTVSPSSPCANWKIQYTSKLTYSTLFSVACL